MKTKQIILLVLVVISLTWFSVWYFSNDKDITTQVKELEEERNALIIENKQLSFKNDSLTKIKQKEVVRYIKIKEQIKQKEDETDSVINNVYTLDEQQLDSTIRAYKHIKRK